jgi:hypothetical protein
MHTGPWSAADLHIHTTASDGVASPEMVLDYIVTHTDLKVVAITDHNTNVGAVEAAEIARRHDYPVEIVVGQEVESADGHILGLWTPELVSPGMNACDTISAIHAQGGRAVAAHPFAPRLWARAGLARGGRRVYDCELYDALEIANSTPLLFWANWRARFYWTAHMPRLAATGGSDAHILPVIGTSRTYFPGETAAELRTALEERSTRVSLPGISLARNWSYARRVPQIIARDRERKAREEELGIRPVRNGNGRKGA